MPVSGLPIVRQAPGAQRQNVAGQFLDPHPGETIYIMPIILKRSRFIIAGTLSSASPFACTSERRPARENFSFVVSQAGQTLRFPAERAVIAAPRHQIALVMDSFNVALVAEEQPSSQAQIR